MGNIRAMLQRFSTSDISTMLQNVFIRRVPEGVQAVRHLTKAFEDLTAMTGSVERTILRDATIRSSLESQAVRNDVIDATCSLCPLYRAHARKFDRRRE